MPGQPGAVHPPEQGNLTSSLAQLHTTVKSQQEEATQRMAQLETALKAQQQEAALALIQQQESTAALKHVADQMAEWRSWIDHVEPPHQRKRFKADPAATIETAAQQEPERKPSTAATYRPTRTGGREVIGGGKNKGQANTTAAR